MFWYLYLLSVVAYIIIHVCTLDGEGLDPQVDILVSEILLSTDDG